MSPEDGDAGRRILPFWVHQAVEYFLAAALVGTAFHVGDKSRWVLIGGAALLVTVAAFSGPPLGAWRAIGRRAHRLVDWLTVILLAASPILPGRGAASILVMEACAVGLWRIGAVTRFDPIDPESPRSGAVSAAMSAFSAASAPRPPASSPPSAQPSSSPSEPSRPLDPAVDAAMRRQARAAGLAVGIVRRRRRALREPRQ